MISLIDADNELPGNLNQLQKDLNEAVQADANTNPNESVANGNQPQRKVRTLEVNDDELPENLKGKDFKDVVRMLSDSQSTIGRMANDLGTQRKLTDRLLDLKRESDLQSRSAPAKVQVSGTELLDNPTEAIERIVASRMREQEQSTQARITQLEGQQQAQVFVTRHADWQEVAADSGFQSWVQATPYRQNVAVHAASGDWGAADELVTEYKEQRAVKVSASKSEKEVSEQKNIEAANKASLESPASGKPTNSGKILRRVDLLKLQMEQPDVYYDEATQAVIMKAYQERRVK